MNGLEAGCSGSDHLRAEKEKEIKTIIIMFYVNDVKIPHDLTEDSSRNFGGDSEILKIDFVVGEVNFHLSFLSKTRAPKNCAFARRSSLKNTILDTDFHGFPNITVLPGNLDDQGLSFTEHNS